MNNQAKRNTAASIIRIEEVTWMTLSLMLLLLVTTGLNTVNATESALERALRTGDFESKTIGYELFDGHNSLIIQAEPRSQNIKNNLGYAKIKAWYDTVDNLTRKIVLIDDDGIILSTVLFTGKEYLKGKNRATHMEVTNHRTGQTCSFKMTSNNQLTYLM